MHDAGQSDLGEAVGRLLTGVVVSEEVIQSLWSGYGRIVRVRLASGKSVVVKAVEPPKVRQHPRGHATVRSHERKLRSYHIELSFYRDLAGELGADCRVPEALHLSAGGGRFLFVLEDLDAAGFDQRTEALDERQLDACLHWLAEFHATFLGRAPSGLWPEGSYWHLETRPDEWELMSPGPLKDSAEALDRRLKAASFRTLIHGDAKVANFCFSAPTCATRVAAVDFQYVGGGVGTKDVAYFFSSVMGERECQRRAPGLLDDYFGHLQEALGRRGRSSEFSAVKTEWRDLYPVAWADFYRFLAGWAPGHAKMHGYSAEMTRLALAQVTR